MNVRELREALAEMPDNTEIVVWVGAEDDREAVTLDSIWRSGVAGSEPDMPLAFHIESANL